MKDSTDADTIRRGIKEALEYLAFLQVNGEYVFGRDDESYFGSGWNEFLVAQDFDDETASIEAQSENPVTILQAAELEQQLAVVLREIP